jgi:hypothetical protein
LQVVLMHIEKSEAEVSAAPNVAKHWAPVMLEPHMQVSSASAPV